MRITYLLLFLTFCFVSCEKDLEYGNPQLSVKTKLTDINTLLEERDIYNNDTLKLKGYISISSENVSVTDGESWIWIDSFEPATVFDVAYEKLNTRPVIIIGLFDSKNTGHMLGYNGGFKEIYYIKTE